VQRRRDPCHMKDNPTVLPVDAWSQSDRASGLRSWNIGTIKVVYSREDFQNFA
jgi:hypothetical protein